MNEEPPFRADLVEENTPAARQAVEPQSLSSKVCKLGENSLREPPRKFDSKAI